MSDPQSWSFETRQIHAGTSPDPTTGARALPIYATTAYQFRDSQHAADLFALAELGNIYTRIMNPTQDVLEQRVASLEGGVAALAGVERPVGDDAGDPQPRRGRRPHRRLGLAVRRHLQPAPLLAAQARASPSPSSRTPTTRRSGRRWCRTNTKAFFAETIGNPKGDILDIEAVAGVAHRNGVPLIVDNTIATPYLMRPFEFGADIVVHSATKYLGGHGTAIAGLIVDGGTFDWPAASSPASPRPTRATTAWSTRDLGAPAYRAQGPRAAAARPRPGDLAVQRLPGRPGHRDAVAAHGAARRRTPRGSRSGWRRTTRSTRCQLRRPAVSPWHAAQQKYAPRAPARC